MGALSENVNLTYGKKPNMSTKNKTNKNLFESVTYRILVVLGLLTLANTLKSKSSFKSPSYALTHFKWEGLVKQKKGE